MKKVRKPRYFRHIGDTYVSLNVFSKNDKIVHVSDLDLTSAKKLQTWLTKAIKYLEQK